MRNILFEPTKTVPWRRGDNVCSSQIPSSSRCRNILRLKKFVRGTHHLFGQHLLTPDYSNWASALLSSFESPNSSPLLLNIRFIQKKVGWCSDLQHSMRNILIGQRSRTSSIPWRKLRREPPLRPLKQEKVSLFQEGRGDQKENIIVISLPPSALLSSNFEPGGLLSALDEHKEGPFISPRTSFWTILTVICCFKTCFRINWTVCVDWSSCKNVKNVFYLPK